MRPVYVHKSGRERVLPVPGRAEAARLAHDPNYRTTTATAEVTDDQPPAVQPKRDGLVTPPADEAPRVAKATGVAKIRTGGAAK